MRKITWLIDQMDLCRELIQRGSISNLRSAVLLLDNAAEILMHRMTQDELRFNDLWERMLAKTRNETDPATFARFCQEVAREVTLPKLLTQQDKRRINRFFPEKLSFLSETKKCIPVPVAAALLSLHDHRNEMYHRDTLRPAILEAMSRLFFQIDCDLLLSQPNGPSYDSRDDWSAFFSRYDIEMRLPMLDQADLATIVANWRTAVSIDTRTLRESLATYSTCRLTDTNEDIVFLQEFFRLPSIQAVVDFVLDRVVPDLGPVANRSVTIVERLAAAIAEMKLIDSTIELFNHFSSIERDFRPIELAISEGRFRVEAGIQLQVDLSLGK